MHWRPRLDIRLLLLAVFLAAPLAGCGGGSGDASASATDRPASQSRSSAGSRDEADETGNAATGAAVSDVPAKGGTAPLSGRPPQSVDSARPEPQPVYRVSDRRPRHDDRRLEAAGIRAFESERLKLYTDIDPAVAGRLPALIDAAYAAWEEYFGRLPPNREGTAFQMTGYLMADEDRFRDAGLIPDDLKPFENGRHRGGEFWMYEQKYDYYRRHLLIHEATHCFMEAIAGPRYYEELPVWYWEGMAELFGTHRMEEDGTVAFRVMPDNRDDFAGLGRITMIRKDVAGGDFLSLQDVRRLAAGDFVKNESYAWSWGLCKFLDAHPRYRQRFRELGRFLTGSRFEKAFGQFVADERAALTTEWTLFAHNVQYGYDVAGAAIDFRAGRPLKSEADRHVAEVAADRGWQSGGVQVEKGMAYRCTATGRFVLARKPKPWVSEPQGISFDYFQGRPLGVLLAAVRVQNPATAREHKSMLQIIPVGREREFVAPFTGTLYLRLNDSWSRLDDNSGSVTVEITRGAPAE